MRDTQSDDDDDDDDDDDIDDNSELCTAHRGYEYILSTSKHGVCPFIRPCIALVGWLVGL